MTTRLDDVRARYQRSAQLYGGAKTRPNGDQEHIDRTRQAMLDDRVVFYVAKVLADAPPLTDGQKKRLRALLAGGVQK